MPRRRSPRFCVCGVRYDDFRTGLTFAVVRGMLRDLPDPDRPGWWRQKRRHGVLGYWHELKLAMWHQTHGYCEEPDTGTDMQIGTL